MVGIAKGIYGFHDSGGEHLILSANRTGWTVHTEALGCDPNDRSSKQYSTFENRITNVCRLNNGYGSAGTIPLPERYADFAKRCANFVAGSQGCSHWIIGNELGLTWEWPEGQRIALDDYVRCFKMCRDAIKSVQPAAVVMPQPPAPWNVEVKYAENPSGDWIKQLSDMLNKIGLGNVDGIAIHTYSHGHDPALVTSEAKMDPPWNHRRFHFRTYIEYMEAIPAAFRNLPVFCTESNPDGWHDTNNGWIQAAYAEINRWNQLGGQQIRSLAFYRWPNADREQFWINSKPGVVEDFVASLAHDYQWSEVVAPATTGDAIALDDLRLRASPGNKNKPDWDTLTTIAKGERFFVVGEGPLWDGMTWLYISMPEGITGWVAKELQDGTKLVQL